MRIFMNECQFSNIVLFEQYFKGLDLLIDGKIKIIEASDSELKKLFHTLKHMSIHTVDLSYNQKLTHIPKIFSTKVKVLDISNCGICELPINLEHVEELNCSNNQIKKLPNNLLKLKVLDISHNSLTELPKNMISIYDMNLDFNEFSYIDITKFPKIGMKRLSVCYNKFQSIASIFANLKVDEFIYVGNY